MKAVCCPRYGTPEIMRLQDVDVPVPGPEEVLVRVRAAGVSISDCVVRSGRVKPLMWLPFRVFVGLRGPRNPILGMELSGDVQAVGARVAHWRPGDAIFAFAGRRFGAYAEYASLRDGGRFVPSDCAIARKPANVSYAEAAAAPSRAMLALHLLKDAGIQRGQKTLIYGASSGVGIFAVQLAKHFGSEVTAVAGHAHFDLVRSLGADRVLDYNAKEHAAIGGPYDLVFDAVGKSRTSALKTSCSAALSRGGKSLSVDRVVRIPAHTLESVRRLIEEGVIRPVLDRAYPIDETAEAHRYVEARHKGGGVAIEMER